MKQKLLVPKDKFDGILKKMLSTTPKTRKEVSTAGRRGSKKPLIPGGRSH